MKKFVIILGLIYGLSAIGASKAPKNIIFIIADGMGFEYLKAARIYKGNKMLNFERFLHKSHVTTCNKKGSLKNGSCDPKTKEITESASAATSIATGYKVANGVLSIRKPGDLQAIETILEKQKAKGKSTGIISTKLVTDATPAAFASHTADRSNTADILRDYFQSSTPNVIFGATKPSYLKAAKKAKIPYQIIRNKQGLKQLLSRRSMRKMACHKGLCPHIFGAFGSHDMIPGYFKFSVGNLPLEISGRYFEKKGVPHLSDMTYAALRLLSQNEKGFFLMSESALPDMIGHKNRHMNNTKSSPSAIHALVLELMELERTVEVVLDFMKGRKDTLLVITADHETGGLEVLADKTLCLGQIGCVPTVKWHSSYYANSDYAKHTGANVPVFAAGKQAERFGKPMNNIDFAEKAS